MSRIFSMIVLSATLAIPAESIAAAPVPSAASPALPAEVYLSDTVTYFGNSPSPTPSQSYSAHVASVSSFRIPTPKDAYDMVQKDPQLVRTLIECLAETPCVDLQYPATSQSALKLWEVHVKALRSLGAAAVPELLKAVDDKDAAIVIASLMILAEDGDRYSDFPHARTIAALSKARKRQSTEVQTCIRGTIACLVIQQVDGQSFHDSDADVPREVLLPALKACQLGASGAATTGAASPSKSMVTSKAAQEQVKENPALVHALLEDLASSPCIEKSDVEDFFVPPAPGKVEWSIHCFALANLGVAAVPYLLEAVEDKDPAIVTSALLLLALDSDRYVDFPHQRVVAGLLKARERQPNDVRVHIQTVISHIVMQQTAGIADKKDDCPAFQVLLPVLRSYQHATGKVPTAKSTIHRVQ